MITKCHQNATKVGTDHVHCRRIITTSMRKFLPGGFTKIPVHFQDFPELQTLCNKEHIHHHQHHHCSSSSSTINATVLPATKTTHTTKVAPDFASSSSKSGSRPFLEIQLSPAPHKFLARFASCQCRCSMFGVNYG